VCTILCTKRRGGPPMQFYRIGDKLISLPKIQAMVEKILRMRMEGYSQQEVAQRLKLDRSLISRLESLGEVRKGARVAVVGFPIKNKEEVSRILQEAGVDYQLIWTEEERQQFVRDMDGQK